MRERKYRAWDIKEKKWISGGLAIDLGDNTLYWTEFGEMMEEAKDVILIDYIGRKDKNNKEIYKGDIVKYDLYEVERFPPRIGFIEWDNYYLRLAINDQRGNYIELRGDLWIEIIGNIYENPELLEKEDKNHKS